MRHWSPYYYVLLFISLFSFIYFFHIFRCSSIGYIYIYSCHILLMNWPLYHYIVSDLPYFLLKVLFWLKICFVWPKYSYLCSLLVIICMEHLFPSFTFSLCVSWELRQVSCSRILLDLVYWKNLKIIFIFFKYSWHTALFLGVQSSN